MNFYENMEKVIAGYSKAGMSVIQHYQGFTFEVFEQIDSVEGSVYGHEAHEISNCPREIQAIFPNEQSFYSSSLSSGIAETVTVRTTDKDVKVGDMLQISRKDGRVHRYSVVAKNKLGQTTQVYFELECSGEGV